MEIHNELSRFCDNDFELIVVNDGSHDSTLDEILKASKQIESMKIVTYVKNNGKGHAIKVDFSHASKDLITFLDGDLDIPPRQIESLLNTYYETGADVVIQSKRHPDSVVNGVTLKRYFLSRSYQLYIKLLFNLPDTQAGCKLFRREVLETIMPKLAGQAVCF